MTPGLQISESNTPGLVRKGRRSGFSRVAELDKIDKRILSVLQKDGRISNLKLAQAVHLSRTAVLDRVRRMTRDGFLLGFKARLNPLKVGSALLVFIEVVLDRTEPALVDKFNAAVQARPEILECHMVAGRFDYLMKVRVADVIAHRDVIGIISCLPGVREIRTYEIAEELKCGNLLGP